MTATLERISGRRLEREEYPSTGGARELLPDLAYLRTAIVSLFLYGPRGAGEGAVLAELLGDGGQGRVGLVETGEGDVDALLGLRPLVLQAGEVEREPLGGSHGLRQRGGRLVDGGLDLDQALE